MNYKLIMLEPYPVIVSDEEIRIGDLVINLNSSYKHKEVCTIDNKIELDNYANKSGNDCQKIIASSNPEHNLPLINFSLLSDGDCKRIGYVDVGKLAEEYSQSFYHQSSFTEGFKKAQSLNSKKFSLEDIEQTVKLTLEDAAKSVIWSEEYHKHLSKKITLSLQQHKVFDIEVERYDSECQKTICDDSCSMPDCLVQGEPKITNNQIKIIKVNL